MLFTVFLGSNSKKLWSYFKSAPSILSLTHIVNFGIGSVFSNDPGLAFPEGPGQGLQYTFFFDKQSKI